MMPVLRRSFAADPTAIRYIWFMNNQPAGCLGFLFGLFKSGRQAAPVATFPKVQVNKFFVSNGQVVVVVSKDNTIADIIK